MEDDVAADMRKYPQRMSAYQSLTASLSSIEKSDEGAVIRSEEWFVDGSSWTPTLDPRK
jgi:hypothetical protein